jgi:hypothetical protein
MVKMAAAIAMEELVSEVDAIMAKVQILLVSSHVAPSFSDVTKFQQAQGCCRCVVVTPSSSNFQLHNRHGFISCCVSCVSKLGVSSVSKYVCSMCS